MAAARAARRRARHPRRPGTPRRQADAEGQRRGPRARRQRRTREPAVRGQVARPRSTASPTRATRACSASCSARCSSTSGCSSRPPRDAPTSSAQRLPINERRGKVIDTPLDRIAVAGRRSPSRSNVGDRAGATSRSRVARLSRSSLDRPRVSRRWHRDRPGRRRPAGPFLNGAVDRHDDPRCRAALLDRLLQIERERGRERPYPGAPRTLDLDLILYGERRDRRARPARAAPALQGAPVRPRAAGGDRRRIGSIRKRHRSIAAAARRRPPYMRRAERQLGPCSVVGPGFSLALRSARDPQCACRCWGLRSRA